MATAKKAVKKRATPKGDKNFQVVKQQDGSFTGMCLRVGQCAPWVTKGWPTEAAATHRMEEHEAEHVSKTPMSDLDEFTAEHAPELMQGA